MRTDTHTHLLYSKKEGPDWKKIRLYLDVARENKVNVLCLTEHLDADHYSDLVKNIFDKNIFGGEILSSGKIRLANSLILSSAAEISLDCGADVGLHAELDVILSLNMKKGFYSLERLVEEVSKKTNDFVLVGHHLFRPGKWIPDIENKACYIDAIELPAKDTIQIDKYKKLGSDLKKIHVSGSDAHTWIQVGAGTTLVEADDWTHKNFKSAINANKVTTDISPYADRLVKISSLYRDYLNS